MGMDPQTFIEKLKQNPRPVVVDLWAVRSCSALFMIAVLSCGR
jgi:hypothetical protein